MHAEMVEYVQELMFLWVPGHYCPAATLPQPCPAGTFNNGTGLVTIDECIDCIPGHYCQGTGNIVPTGKSV